LQKLIVEMANENPTWGEERIAAELLLKFGIRISPRTVRRYMPEDTSCRRGPSSQRWVTFVRNHAQGLLACDFFVGVTGSFRVLYVFVIMEVGTRRIAHCNVTTHPTADWTLQQFRETITGEKPYRLLIHDRDNIYSSEFDSVRFGPEVDGLEHLENAVPRAPGERFLRTPRRKYPPRVFGFPDSAERETPAENSQGVGGSLQPRPPTLQSGARYSRTVGRHSGAPNFRSPYSVWSPGGSKTCSGRSASTNTDWRGWRHEKWAKIQNDDISCGTQVSDWQSWLPAELFFVRFRWRCLSLEEDLDAICGPDCDTGSKEIGILRPDAASESEGTSQYGPVSFVATAQAQSSFALQRRHKHQDQSAR
jgi:hypothetical protein